MIKTDRWIDFHAERGMIFPYCNEQVSEEVSEIDEGVVKKVISYGLSSFGYDIRLSDEFKIVNPAHITTIDPKRVDDLSYIDVQTNVCTIPPNSFVLAKSVEHLKIPRDVMTICLGKSTYARCGIITNVTPLEPGWEGTVTIEISNTTPLPAKVYAFEGIIQVLFFQSDSFPITTYDKRGENEEGGKYHNQVGITLPR